MEFREPARLKVAEDYQVNAKGALWEDDQPLIWVYSATAKIDGIVDRIDVRVLKRIVKIGETEYELEPGWNDVMAALKAEVQRREAGWRSIEAEKGTVPRPYEWPLPVYQRRFL